MNELRRHLLLAAIWGGTVLVVVAASLWIGGRWYDEWSGYNASYQVSNGYCSIAVIPIQGNILPFAGADRDGISSSADLPPSTDPDTFHSMLRAVETDPHIQGVLVSIDSYGGSPVASEIIADLIRGSSLPVVALIREAAVSGGYLAATGADTIIASPLSDVGGIGITMSYLDNSEQNAKEGLSFVSLSSAQYKDAGVPDKPLTAAERALFERDLKLGHEWFVKKVAENRALPIDEVTKLADGSTLPGSLAFEKGLIDQLGDIETARAWFAKELSIPATDLWFCP